MTKNEAIIGALQIICPNLENIISKYAINSRTTLSTTKFIDLISRPKYSLTELGLSSGTVAKLLKELFPTRITNSTGTKVCGHILASVGHKYCSKCDQVYSIDEFRVNSSKRDGLNTCCKYCQSLDTKITQPARQQEYRAAKLHRTPKWANIEKIKEIYKLCPEGFHVDHIIPLQGIHVSGLHVENNLQYLSAHDNLVKHNKFDEKSI